MAYDFQDLNDKDFEILCVDIIGHVENTRIERFKSGKDRGVDGCFFSPDGGKVVLQFKHRLKTPISQLIKKLQADEAPKVRKLNPSRYILAVSQPLSESNKIKLIEIFSPYIQKSKDIYGQEDLNDLLEKNESAQRRHYKIWMKSAAVLDYLLHKAIYDRSQFAVEDILDSSRLYVMTENHEAALKLVEKNGVVVIAGEPGIGKTTLADHLCLKYISDGYEFTKASSTIEEFEKVYKKDQPQIFYFDDFLGRNFLEALSGHEGSQIVSFIRRVQKDRNKRLILTSRSTVFNRAKSLIDTFGNHKIDKHEYILKIGNLAEIDKARILYNHIWFSNLEPQYIEEIYKEKRYRSIVRHRNFNPRLISFVTDAQRLTDCPPESYWETIKRSLDNPADVWEHPFTSQLDDYGRQIVMLVTFNNRKILEPALSEAFGRYVEAVKFLKGSKDFWGNLRQLTGSFLTRTVGILDQAIIDLFNPSIADFVLRRYSKDANEIATCINCLRSSNSLNALKSIFSNSIVTRDTHRNILIRLLISAKASGFNQYSSGYLSNLAYQCVLEISDAHDIKATLVDCARFLLDREENEGYDDSAMLFLWLIEQGWIDNLTAIKFADRASREANEDEEIKSICRLLESLPTETSGWGIVYDQLIERVFELVEHDLETYINEGDVFSEVDFGDANAAEEGILDALRSSLKSFSGLQFSEGDLSRMLKKYNVEERLLDYQSSAPESDSTHNWGSSSKLGADVDIDDVFRRD